MLFCTPSTVLQILTKDLNRRITLVEAVWDNHWPDLTKSLGTKGGLRVWSIRPRILGRVSLSSTLTVGEKKTGSVVHSSLVSGRS